MHLRHWGRSWVLPLVMAGCLSAGHSTYAHADYRRDDSSFRLSPLPEVRLAVGPGWGISPSSGADTDLFFTLAGGLKFITRNPLSEEGSVRFFLQPELAYSFRRLDDATENHFNLGLGLGLLFERGFGLSYTPWFVAGNQIWSLPPGPLSRTAVGLRHGLRAATLHGLLSFELSHQVLQAVDGGKPHHDVRLLAGIDLTLVVYGAAAVALFAR